MLSCRPSPEQTVERILSFEVAGSTEWQTQGLVLHFSPIGLLNIRSVDTKARSFTVYSIEMRPWPHARSLEALEHLAVGVVRK